MSPQHRTVLVAEDNPMLNQFLCDFLKARGYTVLSCLNGLDAQHVAVSLRPDLLVSDLAMEVPDAGIRLVAGLRAQATTCRIPAIICSANLVELERQQARAAALNAHLLAKPYDPDHLLGLIRQLLQPVTA